MYYKEKMRIFIGFILLGSLLNISGYAQSSVENIRKLREKTIKEIEYANKLLEETKGKTKQSLQEVNIMNEKLKKRREYIVSLEAETALLGDDIDACQNSVSSIEKNLEELKKFYASMLVRNYKSRTEDYFIIFLLASENMNQMYQRFRFVKIYLNYVKIQKDKYEKMMGELVNKKIELQNIKSEKEKVAKSTKKEYAVIKEESSKKVELLNSLKKKQVDIEKEIGEKEKITAKLDRELTKVIENERIKSGSSKSRINLTPAEQSISGDFGKNLGKLPWPTQKGFVSGKYGEHEHPDFKSVKIRNDGIYITTGKGEYVRSVFKGVVSKVFSIPGENFTVIIKHGNYYTLYHNIVDVVVKAGQNVDTKEVIGKVFTDGETRETTLYFQLWKETERNDPELWLSH
jgi:murein hydrolase activator